MFLRMPTVGTGETILSQMSESERPVERLLLATTIILEVEQIGSGYYLPGTIAKIENERKRVDVLDVPEVAEVQKLMTSKAVGAGTGTAAGAFIGGLIGSVVPILGTAAGASAGAAVGAVVVVSVWMRRS